MKNVIIIFERPDVSSALALQSQLVDSEVWVFDPHLVDNLALAGVVRCKYIECDLNVNLPQHIKDCRSEALLIEQAIEADLRTLFPGFIAEYWQHLNWFDLQSTFLSYWKLWNSFLKSEYADIHFHIVVQDTPVTYYDGPSFFPAVMLMEQLNGRGIQFSAYTHSSVNQIHQFIPASESQITVADGYQYFVHLPTCIYDYDYLETEIASSANKVLNFASQKWNPPFSAFPSFGLRLDTEVLQELNSELAIIIEQATEVIEERLFNHFHAYIFTEMYARRQAHYTALQYRAQLIFFHYLEHNFFEYLPSKIILSNHDAGLHGPFLSFAKKYNIPVLMLPHAKVFNFPIPSSHANIIALTHPIQGGDISTICGKHVLTATINFHESVMLVAKAPKPLASVGLILNKFSNEGMTLIDTSIYINGIKSIMEWCRQNSILLKIRLKPSGTCIQWLVNELGLNVEDLISNLSVNISDFGRECDVCLMYDAPTSGAIDFLRNSIPVLSTVIRDLCPEETRIISSEIVSRNSITETLAWLDSFKNDPINLILFRTRQFGSYASLLSQSSPLRMFL